MATHRGPHIEVGRTKKKTSFSLKKELIFDIRSAILFIIVLLEACSDGKRKRWKDDGQAGQPMRGHSSADIAQW
ncbi:hypothetical protein PPOP_0248 [Paenibacillus popilliae ATCC 14706]|uniref:Uncharacterized protein n=1 Tax=Paenibacillus popilliae ATCC 14706 TaxID=1212764 RepID=M9LLC1_PAEPP|nr:hypothetical protein PPOP_0248 [Paenibacillus popilliae ATCC 14706]